MQLAISPKEIPGKFGPLSPLTRLLSRRRNHCSASRRADRRRLPKENADDSTLGLARLREFTQDRGALFQSDGRKLSCIDLRGYWRAANARRPSTRGGCGSRNGFSYPLSRPGLSIRRPPGSRPRQAGHPPRSAANSPGGGRSFERAWCLGFLRRKQSESGYRRAAPACRQPDRGGAI
jgi:hypothetical protein